jgi:hypothetical protein
MASMFNQNKKYAVYCAITIAAGAFVGMSGFFASERSDAKDSVVSFDLGCIREHGMIAGCEATDHGHSLYGDFSKAAAKFLAPMPGLRVSPLHNGLASSAIMARSQQKLLEDTGDNSMKTLALTAMRFSKSDVERASDLKMQIGLMGGKDKKKLEKVNNDVLAKAKDMAGVTEPLGFFDPIGFCSRPGLTEGKICFYREVELKHGRVAMLASLGFLVGEQFHPLFGGDIDVPSYIAFQASPLEKFWPAVVAAIAVPEFISAATFQGLQEDDGEMWSMRTDRQPGDFRFDPLGLKPKDPEEFKVMQTKELNNGRLAMIAAAGMVAQELATGQKLF